MKNTSLLKKLTAIFLSVSLTVFNSLSYAESALPQQRISIPKEMGTVEESFHGANGKTIIYIQDAHDSLEAQENIAKIIDRLVMHYGAKVVFEEGYEGPVPTDKYFGVIRDPKIREKVAYFLMDKLRIGGAEYAHIIRTKNFRLIGADNLKLHKKNIKKYQDSVRQRKEVEKDLVAMNTAIRRLAQKYFPKDLKEWMAIKERLDRHEIDLINYLRRIRFPHLDEFLKLKDAKTLFEEINRFEDDFAKEHLKETRDREIFRYYKLLQLLKRLNAIEITEDEYEAVKKDLKGANTAKIAQFIVAQNHKSVLFSKTWESHIQSAIEFYEVAKERDASIWNCLEEYRKSKSEGPIVLVYGGFHKGNIKKMLNKSGFSYSIVTPKITSVSAKHLQYYKQLMQIGYDSISVPTFVAKATTAPRVLDFPEPLISKMVTQVVRVAAQTRGDSGRAALAGMDLKWNEQNVKSVTSRSEMRNLAEDLQVLKRAGQEIHKRIKPFLGLGRGYWAANAFIYAMDVVTGERDKDRELYDIDPLIKIMESVPERMRKEANLTELTDISQLEPGDLLIQERLDLQDTLAPVWAPEIFLGIDKSPELGDIVIALTFEGTITRTSVDPYVNILSYKKVTARSESRAYVPDLLVRTMQEKLFVRDDKERRKIDKTLQDIIDLTNDEISYVSGSLQRMADRGFFDDGGYPALVKMKEIAEVVGKDGDYAFTFIEKLNEHHLFSFMSIKRVHELLDELIIRFRNISNQFAPAERRLVYQNLARLASREYFADGNLDDRPKTLWLKDLDQAIEYFHQIKILGGEFAPEYLRAIEQYVRKIERLHYSAFPRDLAFVLIPLQSLDPLKAAMAFNQLEKGQKKSDFHDIFLFHYLTQKLQAVLSPAAISLLIIQVRLWESENPGKFLSDDFLDELLQKARELLERELESSDLSTLQGKFKIRYGEVELQDMKRHVKIVEAGHGFTPYPGLHAYAGENRPIVGVIEIPQTKSSQTLMELMGSLSKVLDEQGRLPEKESNATKEMLFQLTLYGDGTNEHFYTLMTNMLASPFRVSKKDFDQAYPGVFHALGYAPLAIQGGDWTDIHSPRHHDVMIQHYFWDQEDEVYKALHEDHRQQIRFWQLANLSLDAWHKRRVLGQNRLTNLEKELADVWQEIGVTAEDSVGLNLSHTGFKNFMPLMEKMTPKLPSHPFSPFGGMEKIKEVIAEISQVEYRNKRLADYPDYTIAQLALELRSALSKKVDYLRTEFEKPALTARSLSADPEVYGAASHPMIRVRSEMRGDESSDASKGQYFYSPSLNAYVDRSPLKIDARVVKAAEELGIHLEWNDEGHIINISQADGIRLLRSIGASALTPAEYWLVLKDARAANDPAMLSSLTSTKFVEWLDVHFTEEDGTVFMIEHPEIQMQNDGSVRYTGNRRKIAIPEGRPGWFHPYGNTDENGLPLSLKSNFREIEEREVWKYWDAHTNYLKTGLGAIRGYVISSGTPSLDLGIPPNVEYGVLMLRAVRKTLPVEATWQELVEDVKVLGRAYQRLQNTHEAFEGFYDQYIELVLGKGDTYWQNIHALFKTSDDEAVYKIREYFIDALGVLQLIAIDRKNTNVQAKLKTIASRLFEISQTPLTLEFYKQYIQSNRARLSDALKFKQPILFVMGHKNPDTDAIISSMAEAYRNHLIDGKSTVVLPVVQGGRIPDEVRTLLGDEMSDALVLTEDELYKQAARSGQAKWVLVDHNYAPEVQKFTIRITDHHTVSDIASRQDIAKTFELIGSTTALIMQKLKGLGVEIDAGLAQIFYGATLMDTENRVEGKMTSKDALVMNQLKTVSGVVDDSALYQLLMDSLLKTDDAEDLFGRDYKEDWGFGFAVAKGKGFFGPEGEVLRPAVMERLLELAHKNNKTKNLPVTLIKIVDYENDNETVRRERMYFVFNDKSSIEFKDAMFELFESVLDLIFRPYPGHHRQTSRDEGYVEYWGTGKQLSRKKTAPLLEPVVAAFDKYFYSDSTGLYVKRNFMTRSVLVEDTTRQLGIPLSTGKGNIINNITYFDARRLLDALGYSALSLEEYWKVLHDAKQANDLQMVQSLQSTGFVEFLDTLVERRGDAYFSMNHPQVSIDAKRDYRYEGNAQRVDIPEGVPGLIHPNEIDAETGYPAKVRSPGDFRNKELWRYWSPDADLTVPTRGHIFLLEQPALDMKIHPKDALPNMGIRVAVHSLKQPRVDTRLTDTDLSVTIKDEEETRSFKASDFFAVPRSEMRKTNERFQSVFDETVHLQNDVVFTIRPETLEKLARAKEADGHDQWLELLGLKMLNEDKLHIVIDSREEQILGDRASELLMNHKKVYLGWEPRTLASLPKNVPVIQFEKLINGQISGDLLNERTIRRINATFDIFDGAFLAALRYAQNPSRLEELARQSQRVVTSATAMDLGLLDQLFKTYAIISQAA